MCRNIVFRYYGKVGTSQTELSYTKPSGNNWVAMESSCPMDSAIANADGTWQLPDEIEVAVLEIEKKYDAKAARLKDMLLTIMLADGGDEAAKIEDARAMWASQLAARDEEILLLIGG